MRVAYDQGAPPYELVLGWLMDRLHKTPEEIERSDIMRILRITDLMGTHDAFTKHVRREKLSEGESRLIQQVLKLDMDQKKEKEKAHGG